MDQGFRAVSGVINHDPQSERVCDSVYYWLRLIDDDGVRDAGTQCESFGGKGRNTLRRADHLLVDLLVQVRCRARAHPRAAIFSHAVKRAAKRTRRRRGIYVCSVRCYR